MDGFLYPFSLLFIAVMAFLLNRANHFMPMLIVLAIGAYIIYSHETGYTATDYKNEMVESLDEAAKSKYQHENEIKSNEAKTEMLKSIDEENRY